MDIIQHCKTINHLPFNFEPDLWKNYWSSNCYEYILNYRNSCSNHLTVGSIIGNYFFPYQSNEILINILEKELLYLGFSIERTDNSQLQLNQKMKIFISRSICGDYHFYRLDSNGKWSHKFGFDEPSNTDFMGKEIVLPEFCCETDINVGYFLISMIKE